MSLTDFPARSPHDRVPAKSPSRPSVSPHDRRSLDDFHWPPTAEERSLVEVIDLGSSEPLSSAGLVALVERAVEPPPRHLHVVPPVPIHARRRHPPARRVMALWSLAAGLIAMYVVESRQATEGLDTAHASPVTTMAHADPAPADSTEATRSAVSPEPPAARSAVPRASSRRVVEPEPVPRPAPRRASPPRPVPPRPTADEAIDPLTDPAEDVRPVLASHVTSSPEGFTPAAVTRRSPVPRGPAPFPAARGSRTRIEVTVDFRGRVESARLLSGGVTYFDERALEAVRTWRFEPARRNGRPVRSSVEVDVTP